MIDTITLEVNTGTPLSRDDFANGVSVKINEDTGANGEILSSCTMVVKPPKSGYGVYLPHVEYQNYPHWASGRTHLYVITCSLPKLVHGNNLMAVREKDFSLVVEKMLDALNYLELPVKIDREMLVKARVRRMDVGLNTFLPENVSVSEVLDYVRLADVRRTYKDSNIEYRNGGESMRLPIKKRSVIFYDKIEELKSTEPLKCWSGDDYDDNNELIAGIIEESSEHVIRFEVQLWDNKQINRELKSLKRDDSKVLFEDLFSDDIASNILLHHWHNTVDNIPDCQQMGITSIWAKQLWRRAAADSDRVQLPFAVVGFNILVNLCGMREVRRMYEEFFRSDEWGRNVKKKLAGKFGGNDIEPIRLVTDSLEAMSQADGKGGAK